MYLSHHLTTAMAADHDATLRAEAEVAHRARLSTNGAGRWTRLVPWTGRLGRRRPGPVSAPVPAAAHARPAGTGHVATVDCPRAVTPSAAPLHHRMWGGKGRHGDHKHPTFGTSG